MTEEVAVFGRNVRLCGILTDPAEPDASQPGLVFLNAGVTHRVGPNRLSVRLARACAADGFRSLRFDFSGIGDSGVRTDDLPPRDSVFEELGDALDCFTQHRGVKRFVLIGICSGASISYLQAKADERVVGAVLINGQGHLHGMDAAVGAHLRSRTLTRHFWRIAFKSSFRAKNWKKALRGQLSPRRILGTMIGLPMRALFGKRDDDEPQTPAVLPDSAADLRSVAERGVRLFHLYSEGDDGLDYFHEVLPESVRDGVVNSATARHEVIPGANHVFTLRWSQDRLVERVRDWLGAFTGASNPPGPSGSEPA